LKWLSSILICCHDWNKLQKGTSLKHEQNWNRNKIGLGITSAKTWNHIGNHIRLGSILQRKRYWMWNKI